MAKVTMVFAVLVIAFGLAGYYYPGAAHHWASLPLWLGVVLGIGGFLAISPHERRRRMFMHVNVVVGVVGFLIAVAAAVQGYGNARTQGLDVDFKALWDRLILAGILLVYINLCVQSFLKARQKREG